MSIKLRTTLVGGGAAIAAALAVLTAPPAVADTGYAAIAYSPATGAYGHQVGMPTAVAAIGEAMNLCRSKGGTDCQLVMESSYHFTCVALVVARDGKWAGGRGYDTAAAMEDATRTVAYERAGVRVCGGRAGEVRGFSDKISLPPQQPAQSNAATVTGDVDVYDAPGGVGNKIGVLRNLQQVQLTGPCRADNWCQVSGQGWVWGDFLKR